MNGEVITTLGVKVSEKDEIMIDGNVLANEQKEYYLLYKPRGIITSTKVFYHIFLVSIFLLMSSFPRL